MFEEATGFFRAFLEEKTQAAQREAKARERTEEMLKHDQRKKRSDAAISENGA